MFSISFKLNSISKRLFFSFGMLLLSIIIISTLAILFQGKTRSIHFIGHAIGNQRVLIVQLIKTDLDFLRFETVNEKFFSENKSSILDKREELAQAIWNNNGTIRNTMLAQDFQDLSGQVIKKVVGILDHAEHQLCQLLAQSEGPAATAAAPARLEGPQMPDKAVAQEDVDDLLASLGF